MKLSNVTAKLTSMKSSAVRVLAVTALAGAALTAAAPAAEAQQFGVAVHVGGPVYYVGGPRYFAPPPPVVFYGRPGFYDHRDWRFHDGYRHGWR